MDVAETVQGVPKKMPHSELRLLGPYRAPLKLTLGLNTPIYDTRVCVGTKETLTLPYIVPYSPYKTTVGTPVSQIFLSLNFKINLQIVDLFREIFCKCQLMVDESTRRISNMNQQARTL